MVERSIAWLVGPKGRCGLLRYRGIRSNDQWLHLRMAALNRRFASASLPRPSASATPSWSASTSFQTTAGVTAAAGSSGLAAASGITSAGGLAAVAASSDG